MNKLLNKEFKLSAHILSYIFIAFGLMAFIPGYPILVSVFFVCLGLFQSFQAYRESNDISFSLLLPISKKDIVKAKFIFAFIIEMCAFLLMSIITLLRMTLLKDVTVYVNNALMTANFVFLGYALVIFGLFNFLFIRGFFKTGYYFGKPFIFFAISAFLVIGIGETLWHIPGLNVLNSFGFSNIGVQLVFLISGVVAYILLTLFGTKLSIKLFDKIDL